MKKILIFLLLLLTLTGCGKKCDYTFNGNMTKDYSKDSSKCEVVTYVDKSNDIEFITTPVEDGDTFNAKINYHNMELNHSFKDKELANTNMDQHNNINFLELQNDNGYINLIVFDSAGNVRYELGNTASPIIDGYNFTVRGYLLYLDNINDNYMCDDYEDLNRNAYIEKTYDMRNASLVSEKEVKLKDICK